MRIHLLPLLLVLTTCAPPDALPEPPIPPPAPVATQATVTNPDPGLPLRLRAALDRAAPRENALAASPNTDSADVKLVRMLNHNVIVALADLERDGGRHVTTQQIERAKTAVKDLENHLNEFAASQQVTRTPR